jgi:CheY-like chemotaxis protein
MKEEFARPVVLVISEDPAARVNLTELLAGHGYPCASAPADDRGFELVRRARLREKVERMSPRTRLIPLDGHEERDDSAGEPWTTEMVLRRIEEAEEATAKNCRTRRFDLRPRRSPWPSQI